MYFFTSEVFEILRMKSVVRVVTFRTYKTNTDRLALVIQNISEDLLIDFDIHVFIDNIVKIYKYTR